MFSSQQYTRLRQERRLLRRSINGPAFFAAVVVIAFFGIGGAWSVLVPLGSAALATGQISPEGHRKTVQHLEGGIIRDIRVQDGDRVAAGDVLLVLEDTQALATYRVQETRFGSLMAIEARLVAEEAGRASADWSAVPDVAGAPAMIEDQKAIFEARTESDAAERNILNKRIDQLGEEINGLKAQIRSYDQQLALIDDEIGMMNDLLDKGLARKPRLLELRRNMAEIAGRLASSRAAIARARQSIGETELQIFGLSTKRRDEAATQLGEIRSQIADLEQRMTSSRDVLARTVITAPNDGTIIDLRLTTRGAVVRPGEPILDIVPATDRLLVDARVSPTNIDAIKEGYEAHVTLNAFPQRNLPRLKGVVEHLSADKLQDAGSGEEYYLARIEIDREQLATLDIADDLVPGMPADTMIFTGTRTFFSYLIDPLIESIDRSFRES